MAKYTFRKGDAVKYISREDVRGLLLSEGWELVEESCDKAPLIKEINKDPDKEEVSPSKDAFKKKVRKLRKRSKSKGK